MRIKMYFSLGKMRGGGSGREGGRERARRKRVRRRVAWRGQ